MNFAGGYLLEIDEVTQFEKHLPNISCSAVLGPASGREPGQAEPK